MIKKLYIFFVLTVIASTGFSAEADGRLTVVGGYGGLGLKANHLNNELCTMIGGRMGILLNRKFGFGLAGYGQINDIEISQNSMIGKLSQGHSGFELQYFYHPEKMIHMSFCFMTGAGTISMTDESGENDVTLFEDEYFIFEPMVTVELNVLPTMTFCLGFGYDIITGLKYNEWISKSEIGGPTAILTLQFGIL